MGLILLPPNPEQPKNQLIYEGEGENRKCFTVCECGARLEIGSFRHTWSIIETRVRWEKHLAQAHNPA